jgi:DNA-directed RNA polymerase subunit RPC12/RpoP
MLQQRVRCPKCQGRLYREPMTDARFALPPELACWQCGWRRAYSPRQFERRLALSSHTDDDRYASEGRGAPAE